MLFFWFSTAVCLVLIGAAVSADRRASAVSAGAGHDFRPAERHHAAGIAGSGWDGRRVFNGATGEYLGRAVGEPHSPDGFGGVISLRQDEEGQTRYGYAVCEFVVLDEPLAA